MVQDYTVQKTPEENAFSFEKTEQIAILSRSARQWTLELNKVSYNGKPAVYDLRNWSPEGKMGKGLTLNEETLKNLYLAITDYFEEQTEGLQEEVKHPEALEQERKQ